MLKKVITTLAVSLGIATISAPAQAHFQLIYTPEANLADPANIPLYLNFWHPMENGHVMDMAKPREFYYVFRGEKHDLLDTLKEVTFEGKGNSAQAFVSEARLQRNGDYIFVVVPEPYYEKSEDIYIQQITKSYVNRGGLPDAWAEPLGLPTEMLPYVKPNNVIVGSTFTAQVLSEGKAVAGAEIEVEYMVAPPEVATNKVSSNDSVEAKGGSIVVLTDENGMFTFGIPKAGFWGFAALGTGPEDQFEGKELSQDAVIWIRADELE
ncbi:Nickel uptake substrate-specific transmembrane region [Oligella ureolytica]|uniref:DUF4198 domain-containing protein n=1 Tax=Oligella ureolytica TaxID=90244 RepID=A0A378XJ91_9BURK|nr:DUF4198 domain-containing protein [Oligella ureolytica]QPT39462.1 DUF4198 domain-containing protein [Oligella ureolytica]SUA56281.1 Nickel uptake substrate-specific transmembrane region [Oligella ureolytica]